MRLRMKARRRWLLFAYSRYTSYRFQKCIDEVLEASAKIGGAPMVGVQEVLAIQHYSSVLRGVQAEEELKCLGCRCDDSLGSEISS